MSVPPEVLELLRIHREIEEALKPIGYKVLGVLRSRDKDGKVKSLEVRLESK